MTERTSHTALSDRLREAAAVRNRCEQQLVVLAAGLADTTAWTLNGSSTAAHWIAAVADIETCTAREWIRIGRGETPEVGTPNGI